MIELLTAHTPGEINEVIARHNSFIILAHQNPDGDAVGACYAMGMALTHAHKNVAVLLDDYAAALHVLPGAYLRCQRDQISFSPEVLLCMDCADSNRLGVYKPYLAQIPVSICIDHHVTNPGFATYNNVDGDASSTCEMVYALLQPHYEITADIGAAIYGGMVFDTGGFCYNIRRQTMEVCARLLDAGVPYTRLYTEILKAHSITEAKLLGRVLSVMEERLDGRIVYSYVTRAALKGLRATHKDLEGVVEYLLCTRGAETAVLFTERSKDEIKISLRSRGINVGALAKKMGGGGHALASGFTLKGNIFHVCGTVLQTLEREMNEVDG
jgi:phosphoesterase RecJ-like protein